MSKARFTTTDVKAMVRDIRSTLLGQRVANVYDISDKTYLLKFAVPGVAEKIVLLLESGIRFHTTKYARDKSNMPSPFTMKVRKYLRTKRLEDVRQVGSDRVVEFKFGSGDTSYHIFLELYASGNIVLTDHSYTILALLRSHQFEDEVTVQVGHIYPIAFTTQLETSSHTSILTYSHDQFIAWAREVNAQVDDHSSAKKAKAKKLNLRQLLLRNESGIARLGPDILEHCLLAAQLQPTDKIDHFLNDTQLSFKITSLFAQLQQGEALLAELQTPGQPGYILLKDKEYIDFVPRRYLQHEGTPYEQFGSFDIAVDEYFCKVEEQKLARQAITAEENAKKRVNKVKSEMENQLKGLSEQQERMQHGAMLVEAHAEDVDKVLLVINSALGAGISWEDIEAMVAAEKAIGNPVASLITQLNLAKNKVTLQLADIYSDEEDIGLVPVDIDITLSARANASIMYTQRKVAKQKEEKTLVASEKAIQAVENQTNKELESQKIKRNLQAVRKVHWFEKFNWFVTTEEYLVLSGRDAQQNEMLVKRYMRNGDAYVHADIHGAASCIVRCKTTTGADGNQVNLPISPFALHEAGNMTVCRSSAWSVKVITSAWWVYAHQVSKTAPSGEYLTTGSFMIYGKKNFLPPMQLEMGFGIMFRLEDSCVPKHLNDRRDRGVQWDEDETKTMLSEITDRYDLAAATTILEEEEAGMISAPTQLSLPQTASLSTTTTTKESSQKQKQRSKGDAKANDQKNEASKKNIEKGGKNADEPKEFKKKKPTNKKKARRYANQDEEDLALAMEALGHVKPGSNKSAEEKQSAEAKQKEELQKKQDKVGVHLLQEDSTEALQSLPLEVRESLDRLVSDGVIKDGEINAFEIKTLGSFPAADGVEILRLFSSGNIQKVFNKSGVMRRYSKDKQTASAIVPSEAAKESADTCEVVEEAMMADTDMSRRERKKKELLEIQTILEEEGVLDEMEGKQADEIEKLTGCPLSDDTLLYAVPMCGPYSALQNFKYRVKLVPGTLKRGKAAKQILDVFMHSRECLPHEKNLLKGLTDPEMVAIMIGDVKVSVPGLQSALQQKKKEKKAASKAKANPKNN